MKKTKALVLGSALALLATGGVVQAGSSYEAYNKNVGEFNGSAYTHYQQQTGLNGTENITFNNENTGGDYTVDIRGQRNSGYSPNTNWVQNVGDNEWWDITRNIRQDADSSYRLQISNDLSTPVKVNVYGKFKTY